MKQRGRKGMLAVVQDSSVSAVERPEPLVNLTPEQRVVWINTVNSLPADWFPRETHETLAQYCRHVVAAAHVSQMLEEVESRAEIDVSDYDKLLKMQERETRILLSLATKMRMTQQSTYHPEKTKGKTMVDKPWED
jgi:hypothetical protein